MQLQYERTEAKRKLLKEQGQTESGDAPQISERWKRVLGSALSSAQHEDSKPHPHPLLSKVVALGREYEAFIISLR